MAEKALSIVTSSQEGRGAYGIRVDTDETVYFPISVADAINLEEFEEIEAILIKNDRPEPVWKAIKVRHAIN